MVPLPYARKPNRFTAPFCRESKSHWQRFCNFRGCDTINARGAFLSPREGCMKKIGLAACLCLLAALHAQNGGTTAFVGARIIDGTGKPPIENGTVLVREGRITAVGAL